MSSVQSVDRAFAVLRALAAGPAGVTELADRVSLPKSTVARLLRTLEALGAVEQLAVGGDYHLGDALADLGAAARPGRSLVPLVRPHLAELNEATGEATGFSVPDGLEMLYLDQITPDGELQVRDWTGQRIPMHAVPSGHVVLASDDQLVRRLVDAGLEPFTERTLTDADALTRRLHQVRVEGYAWAMGEYADGLNSVAAPLRDRSGRVVGAIHVYGPASSLPGGRDPAELGRLVVATAARVRID